MIDDTAHPIDERSSAPAPLVDTTFCLECRERIRPDDATTTTHDGYLIHARCSRLTIAGR